MAISAVHYQLLKEHAHLFPRGGSLLEIGEANWYGDMPPQEFCDAMGARYLTDIGNAKGDLFKLAKIVYQKLFAPAINDAIDYNGTIHAMQLDLNSPIDLPRKYDVVINHGTAEHIFNIAMVFKSMHDWTKTGGHMVHEVPCVGWVDHGFYCLQPGLFYDLSAANEYELISLSIAHIESRQIIRVESREHCHALVESRSIPNNALLFVVMRKVKGQIFRVPMQGIYDGKLSAKGQEAWQTAR